MTEQTYFQLIKAAQKKNEKYDKYNFLNETDELFIKQAFEEDISNYFALNNRCKNDDANRSRTVALLLDLFHTKYGQKYCSQEQKAILATKIHECHQLCLREPGSHFDLFMVLRKIERLQNNPVESDAYKREDIRMFQLLATDRLHEIKFHLRLNENWSAPPIFQVRKEMQRIVCELSDIDIFENL